MASHNVATNERMTSPHTAPHPSAGLSAVRFDPVQTPLYGPAAGLLRSLMTWLWVRCATAALPALVDAARVSADSGPAFHADQPQLAALRRLSPAPQRRMILTRLSAQRLLAALARHHGTLEGTAPPTTTYPELTAAPLR